MQVTFGVTRGLGHNNGGFGKLFLQGLVGDIAQQGLQDEPRRPSADLLKETIRRICVRVKPRPKGRLRRLSRCLQSRHKPGLLGNRPDFIYGQRPLLTLDHQTGKLTEGQCRFRCRSHLVFLSGVQHHYMNRHAHPAIRGRKEAQTSHVPPGDNLARRGMPHVPQRYASLRCRTARISTTRRSSSTEYSTR